MVRRTRESTWLVASRCLAIIRRVQRGPATWKELVEAVRREVGRDAYGEAEGKALHRRLENDLARIRERLGVEIRYSRQEKGYIIYSLWVPLLDLPDEDLRTIAWLGRIFDYDSPYCDEVHAFLNRIVFYLGDRRAPAVRRYAQGLEIDLRQRDSDEVSPETVLRLERAIVERRWIELDYLSPQYEDGIPRRHRVAPVRVYFDPGRGHYYLYGWCRTISGPEGTTDCQEYLYYRVGRIRRLRLLPDVVPPVLPRGQVYEVVYELAPEIARLGITRHPEITVHEVEQREDGSALVRGETHNLFWAVQRLLQYGAGCRVLGGPELLAEMRQVVGEMARLYTETP
ncbi:MAG: WYL domain-containing protein [Anaerolineae bacterium]|nr:WYL domain-containing protein [Anaerolineae bacterium]MCX8066811.1 WYL domain-containing protein [Anaerolineae bacterium]MDW7991313.1 WYL domain-containing protein [Anaerolineae bacterium]